MTKEKKYIIEIKFKNNIEQQDFEYFLTSLVQNLKFDLSYYDKDEFE